MATPDVSDRAPPADVPDRAPAADERPADRRAALARPLLAAVGTSALVTVVSRFAPERFAATGVGVVFLGATWALVLNRDEHVIRAHGLSLGGLLEPVRLQPRRLLRDAAIAVAWASLLALVAFPPFWLGYRAWVEASAPFVFRWPRALLDDVAGQLVVIALPEEAFFRGYLQTALDAAWPPRWRLLGAQLGPGWLASAAIFALGHLLTVPHPARLAVFFPALLFGWLRARTRGIGAPLAFHAACNLFSATLARGYGL